VTAQLSRVPASGVPPVLAVDLPQRWMLLRGAPGHPLDESRDLAVWERAAAAYGRFQLAAASSADALAVVGCPALTAAQLQEDVLEVLASDEGRRASASCACAPRGCPLPGGTRARPQALSLAAPSPGLSSSSGRSRPTFSPASAAGAPGASSPSSFAPPRPGHPRAPAAPTWSTPSAQALYFGVAQDSLDRTLSPPLPNAVTP
jgi:hypothetical protein